MRKYPAQHPRKPPDNPKGCLRAWLSEILESARSIASSCLFPHPLHSRTLISYSISYTVPQSKQPPLKSTQGSKPTDPEGFIKSSRWLTFEMPLFLQRQQSQNASTVVQEVPQEARVPRICVVAALSQRSGAYSLLPQPFRNCFTPGNLTHGRMAE